MSAAASKNFQGVTDFLGSTTSGGFLGAAATTLSGIMDSTSGTFAVEVSSIAGEINGNTDHIAADQDRINVMTANLTSKMSSADALIASMQQQVSTMTSLFASMTANQNALTFG